MSGLAALLDDVAAIARIAASSVDDVAAGSARASGKAAALVVDDAAVTPQYVSGISPKRELPMIRRIALGSLRNKLAIILPWALLLSEFAPVLLTPLLMLGGSYLSYEGAEKIWAKLRGHHEADPAVDRGPEDEEKLVSGAIRTDFILSCEIMVISLNEVADAPMLHRSIIMVIVGIGMTLLVYGAVGLIVKIDDIGVALTERDSESAQKFGRALVHAMPRFMTVLTVVGTFAMLWVGGHIILVGLDTFGLSAPYALVHHAEEIMHRVPAVGGFLAWLTNTFFSMVMGAIWGGIILAVVGVVNRVRGTKDTRDGHDGEDGHADEPAASPAEDAH